MHKNVIDSPLIPVWSTWYVQVAAVAVFWHSLHWH